MTQYLVISDQAAAGAGSNGVLAICPDHSAAVSLASQMAQEDPSTPVRVYEQTDVISAPSQG